MVNGLYEIKVNNKQGEATTLAQYEGKALLIVNVASACGFTPQYEGLEKLYREYRGRGFEILAFPCNDFGAQEPGTMAEIEQFCKLNYGVTFPLYEKLHCIGEHRHPLYTWLVEHSATGEDVKWNFEKFLIARDGKLTDRFSSKVEPGDEALAARLEQVLG